MLVSFGKIYPCSNASP